MIQQDNNIQLSAAFFTRGRLPDTVLVYVNLGHSVKTSYYLVPKGTKKVNLVVAGYTPELKTVEFLDSHLQPFRHEEIVYSGIIISADDFLDNDLLLRFSNGRLLSIGVDKWAEPALTFHKGFNT